MRAHHPSSGDVTSSSGLTIAPRPFELDASFIRETLSIYTSEAIGIISASTDLSTTSATIKPSPYPFTKPGHINYLTAAMASLYVSQVGYLHTRLLILHQPDLLDIPLEDEAFLSARDRGDILFRNLAFHFSRRMPIAQDFDLHLRHTSVRRWRSLLVSRFEFFTSEREAVGSGISTMLFSRVHDD